MAQRAKQADDRRAIMLPEDLFTGNEKITIQKLTRVQEQLKGYFVEREDIIEIMMVAYLSQQHVVTIGPPGTAKSYLIECFNAHFPGVTYFAWQVNKFTVPEEIFGPYSLAGLRDGKYERITTGKLPEASIVYLDEVFNANSSILNALNSAMNERTFQGKRIPLRSFFGATNFMPEERTLVAFFDRLLFHVMIDRIRDASNFDSMLVLPKYSPELTIDDAEILALQSSLQKVSVKSIIPAISKIRELLAVEHVEPSDRRFKWALDALRARALLQGRTICTQDDLWILKNILWTDPKEVGLVESTIMKAIDPEAARIKDLYNQAIDIEKQMRPLDPDKHNDHMSAVREGCQKLTQVAEAIASLRQNATAMQPKVRQIAENLEIAVKDMRAKILKQKLGL